MTMVGRNFTSLCDDDGWEELQSTPSTGGPLSCRILFKQDHPRTKADGKGVVPVNVVLRGHAKKVGRMSLRVEAMILAGDFVLRLLCNSYQ